MISSLISSSAPASAVDVLVQELDFSLEMVSDRPEVELVVEKTAVVADAVVVVEDSRQEGIVDFCSLVDSLYQWAREI